MTQELVLQLKKGTRASAKDLTELLRKALASKHGIELASLEEDPAAGALRGSAKVWVPLDLEKLGALRGVHVPVPVSVDVRLEGDRATASVRDPSPEDVGEAASYVTGLAARGQIAAEGNAPRSGTTHRIETDARGRRLLKRTRFSALAG
jgi:hypothetical protein